ncbi:MAG: ABC transporter permease subunit [Phycisphaerales bacterium]|nr:ABC transporter permease subunit [Planctomycetota bacterium]MBL6997472.1 ABC transporter permease subunit [Phycisphaerales bacterium]
MPNFFYWFLRFSILNPICIRLVGAASRRHRDLYIRSVYIAILATVLIFGLLAITSVGRFSLRELAAGSAGVFSILALLQLLFICVLTPVFMAGAISKEANPQTWDIVLTTPLSPLQIILGNIFGRLFFILALLIGALPIMIVTQFFGGVPLRTILFTQLVAGMLALVVASIAIGMSVTRTAGRKAAVSFFVITVLYLLLTFAIDRGIREPVSFGSGASWTTILTPFNPFLVLEALLKPSTYVVPETSILPWPLGWVMTHPVAGWSWLTLLLSAIVISWSSLQVRKLGDRSTKGTFWKRLFQQEIGDRDAHAVSGNPISWRERVTRHRNIGSLLGRWGFVAICSLASIILTTLFLTTTISGDFYRNSILFLVIGEFLIVTFSAISLSSSAIAKEREDGSLDLLLTTSITPRMYLGGKMRGLVLHLLPMALVPCITMMGVGLLVLVAPNISVVSDVLVQPAYDDLTAINFPVPLALFSSSLLFPVVFIPYIMFCMTLGLLWSVRSKGTISAIITTLIFLFVITAALNICLIPAQSFGFLGSITNAISPLNDVISTLNASILIHPTVQSNGVANANIYMGIASIISGLLWSLMCLGLLRSMSSSFVVTVRRLAGIN